MVSQSTQTFPLIHHRAELPDCSLFYQRGGGDSITPILFLHGWGISTEPYHDVLTLLAQQHAVVAPDLPSFGRSPHPQLIPDYDTYARLLLSFMDAIGLEQVHLVGHSIGGGISITLAAMAPARVKSTVLVDSTGIPFNPLPGIVVARAIEMTAQLSLPTLKLQLVEIPQVFISNLLFNTGNVLQALLVSLQADLRPLMPRVQAPTLLLWSQKDLTTPLEMAHEVMALIPNTKLITVEEGWHEWGLWHPQKLTAIVLDFVQQQERSEK